jgi:tetratricopeptide (TPR) repeat protein
MFDRQQQHNIHGDNVGRDKIIHNHLHGSVDYQQLVADIKDEEELLAGIAPERADLRQKHATKLNKLCKELEDFTAEVFRLHELFTRIPINTERLRQAKAHFDRGEFREADAVLKAEEINAEVAQLKLEERTAEDRLAAVRKDLADKANEFLLKAQLSLLNPAVAGESRFTRTEGYFKQALAAARTVEVLFEYARFLYKHNAFRQAEPLYEEALKQCRSLAEKNPAAFLPDVAGMLNNLGELYRVTNAFGPALTAYEEALQIKRSLAEKNPEALLPYVAGTLNNLAGLHYAQNAFGPALAACEEALTSYRSLAAANPEAFLQYVAMTLNNLANLHSNQNAFAPALAAYEEALKLYRSLAVANPEAFLPYVAGTLNNLAALHYAQKAFSPALAAYQEALQVRRSLAAASPEAFLPDVAMTLNNLAVLHRAQNAFGPALAAYEEALTSYRSLAAASPEAFLPDLAMTLINLSIYYLKGVPDRAKSVAYAQEAHSILIPLCAKLPHLQQRLDTAVRLLAANGAGTAA